MRFLRIVALAAGLAYLIWRLLFTWEGANPVLFFLLLAAEAFGVLRFGVETSLLGDPRPAIREPVLGIAPDADVIVVVTDEPTSEVRAAVLSARLVTGYREIVIVDRDDRPQVRELADRLEIRRIAGGWNADLGELIDTAAGSSSSLFALLVPADVVVMPDVLEVVGPTFDDAEVGVVVCRIENTNAAHEVDFGGYGEELIRDALMVDRLDRAGALPWWPGMAVVRRSALVEAGGMASGRSGVTLATGVRIQAAGWRMTDVPVVTARRLAPWTDDRHLHRWARGLHERLAVLVDSDAPRRGEHSTRLTRRVYRVADLHVGRAIQRLVLIGVLVATLFSPSLPLVAPPLVLAGLWSTWMFTSVGYRRYSLRSIGFTPWMVKDLRLLTTDLAVAARALRGQELDDEAADRAPGRRARTVLLVALQFGLVACIGVFGTGLLRPAHGDFATLVALGAAAWLWFMVLQARTALKLTQNRQNFRTADELEVVLSDAHLRVVGLSPFGMDVVTERPLIEGGRLRVRIALPQRDGSRLQFDCPTSVRRVSRAGDCYVAYLTFSHLSDEAVDRITEYCAVVAGYAALRGPDTSEATDQPDVEFEVMVDTNV